jgi:membrane-associated phospholipid phosphatase
MTKIVFISIIFGINVVLPMLLIYLLKLFGLVKDVGLNDRNERFVPYLITVVCLAGSSLFLALKGAPQWVWLFYLGGAAAGVVNMLINFKWKISAHAAGIAGVVAMMIRLSHVGTPQIDLLGWVVVWILLAGLLGASRIYLHRHTFLQVLGGYATGFLGVYLSMLFA